jgi:hypothetical protein
MRVATRTASLVIPRLRTVAPAISAVLLLLLGACAADTPTVPGDQGGSTLVARFPVAAGATQAAAMATNQLVRRLPTLQAATAARTPEAASGSHTGSPFDLTFNGGPVVTEAMSYNLYVNCSGTPTDCWGTGSLSPATYLRDLNVSPLLEVANQYLNEDVPGKFAVTELEGNVAFASSTATLNDIFSIIYSASNFVGASGYTNIFHVFLPRGTDMCITASDCYSPDNPATWTFCAFHGSVDFSASQHVLYTVQPYQAVPGCVTPNQTRVIDATASTLTHEFFETITDPDLSTWYNWLTGDEIADLCIGLRNNERMGPDQFVVQEMFSNKVHACTDRLYP